MICYKCGKRWNADISNRITSTTFICPFCGGTLDIEGKSKIDIGDVIRSIQSDFGEEVLEDVPRLNALLMDYAPSMTKERKLIINSLKEGLLAQIHRGLEDFNNDVTLVSQKCTTLLVSELWITETAAKYAVNAIIHSIGYAVDEYEEYEINEVDVEDNQLVKGDFSFGSTVRKEDLNNYSSIGYKAFAANEQLREIDIPDNILRIHPKAFINCKELSKITISNKTEAIGKGAFDGCNSLKEIAVVDNPNYTVSDGMLIDKKNRLLVRRVDDSRESVAVVNGVRRIGRKSFERTSVKRVSIPKTVDVIEGEAFFLTMQLQKFDVDPSNKMFRSIDGVLYSRDTRVLIRYPQGRTNPAYYIEDDVTSIGKKAFSCATKLESITFDGKLKDIEENAFEYCTGIENIMLPRSVETIGERAFQYCEKLKSAMLPQGIVTIGDCAFLSCKLLKTISIPKSVTTIGNMAFAGCESLSTVVIQENVNFIGDRAFDGCDNLEITVVGNDYVATYCKLHGIRIKKA